MEIKRLLTNVCSKDLEKSKLFYTSLFSFDIDFDSDWFVHLVSKGRELELGIILENHETVPQKAQGSSSGVFLTFVVENVDTMFQTAQKLNCEIIQPPEITSYGQKRMLLLAPEGTICDISSLT